MINVLFVVVVICDRLITHPETQLTDEEVQSFNGSGGSMRHKAASRDPTFVASERRRIR